MPKARSKDVLGRVYEYFLSRFASAEGKKGGEFYTPPAPSSSSWSKCWSLFQAGSTTHAAVPPACSCSRSNSSVHTPVAMEQVNGCADVPGFCKSAALEEIRRHGHVLTPGRYVGIEPHENNGEPFEDAMKRLTARLREQQAEAAKLDAAIAGNLKTLGFGNSP